MAETAGLAFERESFVEIEDDDGVFCEFEQKVPQSTNRKLMRDVAFVFDRGVGVTRFDLAQGVRFETVDQVIGFDAKAFAARHLDECAFAVFVRQLETKLLSRRRRQCDHLVSKMHARLFTTLRRDRCNAFFDDLLRIRLTRVDDVIYRLATAEMGVLFVVRVGGRDPKLLAVGVGVKQFVVEIKAQDAEFPHLIGDVFARVSDRSVRADEDLVGFVVFVAGVLLERHHPATGLFAFVDVVNDAELFHLLERLVPEMQVQDLRFTRQQIVANTEPLHRVGDALDVARRDVIGELGGRVVAGFDQVQNLGAFGFEVFVGLIFLPNARVKIPAIVVERLARGIELSVEGLDRFEIAAFDVNEANDDVSHLNARVINVILHLDTLAVRRQDTLKRIAKHRIPDMPDVRGFVWIDGSVFDANLRAISINTRQRIGRCIVEQELCTVKIDVEVARPSDLDVRNGLEAFDVGLERLGDRTRILFLTGALLDQLRHLKSDREGNVAKLGFRRSFSGDGIEFDAKSGLRRRSQGFAEQVLYLCSSHRCKNYKYSVIAVISKELTRAFVAFSRFPAKIANCMKSLHFDCFAGASGNMILGALIALGVDRDALTAELSKLGLPEFSLEVETVDRSGISSTHVNVVIPDEKAHRHLHHIVEIIQNSTLSDSIKQRSIAIFTKLAEAEAKVHGTDIQKVHFHEVGALDAIIDIVGSCIGFDMLGIERFTASKLHVGSGFVDMAHGKFPVPPPAVAEIVSNIPIYSTEIEGELLTPTGAAIIATVCSEFGKLPEMKVEKTGYGAGTREYKGFPNVLRLMIGESTVQDTREIEILTLIETNIDDASPQVLGHVMDRAFAVGALDCWFTPIMMKKNRPATMLSVLCEQEIVDEIRELLYTETPTLGLRITETSRESLSREIVKVKTKYGDITVKTATLNGNIVNVKPEYDDVRRLAIEHGVPFEMVSHEASLAINKVKTVGA